MTILPAIAAFNHGHRDMSHHQTRPSAPCTSARAPSLTPGPGAGGCGESRGHWHILMHSLRHSVFGLAANATQALR